MCPVSCRNPLYRPDSASIRHWVLSSVPTRMPTARLPWKPCVKHQNRTVNESDRIRCRVAARFRTGGRGFAGFTRRGSKPDNQTIKMIRRGRGVIGRCDSGRPVPVSVCVAQQEPKHEGKRVVRVRVIRVRNEHRTDLPARPASCFRGSGSRQRRNRIPSAPFWHANIVRSLSGCGQGQNRGNPANAPGNRRPSGAVGDRSAGP